MLCLDSKSWGGTIGGHKPVLDWSFALIPNPGGAQCNKEIPPSAESFALIPNPGGAQYGFVAGMADDCFALIPNPGGAQYLVRDCIKVLALP